MQSFHNVVKEIESCLTVNQLLEISFDHSRFLEEYRSRMEQFLSDGIAIAMPTKLRVPVHTHCWVYYVYKGQRYGFESTVTGYARDNVALMILARPSEILRLQRRKFFRVPVTLPVTAFAPGQGEERSRRVISGEILNISSGGILMSTEEELPLGSELLLFFVLSEEIDLEDIPARVVRGGVIEKRKRGGEYEYGIEFVDIHTRLRDSIMRFVFKRQIDLERLKRQ